MRACAGECYGFGIEGCVVFRFCVYGFRICSDSLDPATVSSGTAGLNYSQME